MAIRITTLSENTAGTGTVLAELGLSILIETDTINILLDTEEQIWLTIAALKELNAQKMGVSHCTGLPAVAIMAQEFGENFFFNNTGNRIDLTKERK